MRKIIRATLLALFAFLAVASPSLADRQIVYPSQNPSSLETNQEARFTRIAFGTWLRDALGPTLSAGGVYTNLSAAPNGGMYIAVAPTASNTRGALYQLAAVDPNPLPQGYYSPQLAADTTLTIVQGLISGPSSSIGPLTAPAGGTSQYYLLEAQVQTTDTTPLPMTFLNGSGTPSVLTVNTVRQDGMLFQAKAGVPAASSPAIPTVDSGWIAIATVLVPGGASSITSGMISALPAFSGFVASGTNVSVLGLTISSLTTAGCLQNNGTGGVISSPCTSGLGSVVGTNPITSTTSSGVATVGCPTCVTSVSGTGNIASTGGTTPSLSLTGTIPFANLPAIPTSTCIGYSGTAFTAPSCLTGLTAGTGVSVGTGANPSFGLSHGDYVDTSSAQAVAGIKTFSSAPVSANGFDAGSSTYGPTSASVNGNLSVAGTGIDVSGVLGAPAAPAALHNNIASDTAGNLVFRNGSNATYYFQNNAGTVNWATISSANINAYGNPFVTGSSTYGPTNATVNGPIVATGYSGGAYQAGTAGTAGVPVFEASGANVALGCNGTAQTCPITFYTAGTGTANTASIDSAGSFSGYNFNGTNFVSGTLGTAGGGTARFEWATASATCPDTFGSLFASTGNVNGITDSLGFFGCSATVKGFAVDASGDMGLSGTVTASNFYVGSRRAWKKDITPYAFDPLAVLGHTDFKQYECKNARCGPIGMKKVGIIADDSPSQISGKQHDHYDGFAMAAIDGAAIVELDHRVAILGGIIAILVVWCLGLTIVLVRRA